MAPLLFAALLLQAAAPGSGEATPFEIDREASVVAVVTHRAGFAARLAHNHLVVATGYDATLDVAASRPPEASFHLRIPVAGLVVDAPEHRARWAQRLAELGVEDELGSPGEDDRSEIAAAMRSEDQLDQERFPWIEVRLVDVREGGRLLGGTAFPWTAVVELTVRDRVVRSELPLRFSLEGDLLDVEATGTFTFQELGIEPYSAALGAVRNANEFDLYLNLKARR